MSCEVDCEQIYPSKKDRPAICGLCETVPEARGQICIARGLIDQTLKGVIKGNRNNVTDRRLLTAIGIDPLTGKRQGLMEIVYQYLITAPAIEAARNRGELDNARIGKCLRGLVDFNLNLLKNNSNNNGFHSLATVSVDTVNSYNPRAVGKRAPHSD